MNRIFCTHPQGSDEWRLARIGKATGSRIKEAFATTKSGYSASRLAYCTQLAIERISQTPYESGFITDDMTRGTELEGEARFSYEEATGNVVHEAGFVYLDTVLAGCSVDGLIGDDGMVEIKCPRSHTHIGYILADQVPPDYVPQMTHNLWVMGRKWADFVSYDPRVPKGLDTFIVRFTPTAEALQKHEEEVHKFLAEVDALERKLIEKLSRYPLQQAA